MGKLQNFQQLSEIHRSLDETLQHHRETLVLFQLNESKRHFQAFRQGLKLHIRFEEEFLLPPYEESGGGNRPGARTDFFYQEHRKILALVEDISTLLDSGDLKQDRVGARRVLEILEREHLLVHLLDHHDRREESFLYPFLDDKIDAATRSKLLYRAEREGAARVPEAPPLL